MSRRYTILITDPEQRAALAAARSLVRAGHEVVTFGANRGLAGWSRSVSAHVDDAAFEQASPDLLEDRLRTAMETRNIDGIFPITDASCRWILPLKGALDATIIGPAAEAYDRASNKALVTAVAEGLGIRAPRQVTLEDPQALLRDSISWTGDTVVKPGRSAVLVDGVIRKFGVRYAEDRSVLQGILERLPAAAFPVLLQERCTGEGAGVFLLRAGDQTHAQFGHRRVREKPPSGGVSTCREAVEPPSELVHLCERLLDELSYQGPAMIEFKRNPVSGEWILMEINARLWGSVQLAVDAGVDFPLATLQWAFGEPIVRSTPRVSTRTTWELGELDHAIALMRRSPAELHLPSGTPTGIRAAFRALLDRRIGEHPEVFRLRDPLPAVAEASLWLRGLLPSVRRNG